MEFAANAVFDASARPARPAQTRPPSSASDESMFDDHLQAAQRAEPSTTVDTQAEPPAGASPTVAGVLSSETAAEAASAELAAVSPAPPAQPAVFVQAVATEPAKTHDKASGEAAKTGAATSAATPASAAQAPNAGATEQPQQSVPGANAAFDDAVDRLLSPTTLDKNAAPARHSAATPAQHVESGPNVPAAPQSASAVQKPALAPTGATPLTDMAELPKASLTTAPAMPAPLRAARPPQPLRHEAVSTPAAARNLPAPRATGQPVAEAAMQKLSLQTAVSASPSTPIEAPEGAPMQPAAPASTAPASSSSPAQHLTEHAAARVRSAAHQVAREIVRRFEGGATRFELRLDPPELGRVEVRLDVSRDNRVTALVAADSPQALTELTRNARELESLLRDAGLELSDSGLSFDLRSESERTPFADFDSPAFDAGRLEEHAPVAARPLGYERWRGVRVDMMV